MNHEWSDHQAPIYVFKSIWLQDLFSDTFFVRALLVNNRCFVPCCKQVVMKKNGSVELHSELRF